MADNNDILELRFYGNEISPSTVKASDIGLLIINFEKAVLQQAKSIEPAINLDEVIFSFEKIEDHSLDLFFNPKSLREILVRSYLVIATAFGTGDYTQINKSSITPLKEIVRFSKKYNCNGSFKLNDETISTFNSNVEIKIENVSSIKGDTTIYGKIIRIGGEEPKLHFRINDDEKLIFDIDEKLAKKLSPKLYDFIGLEGTATWNITSYNIENFEIKRIIELENKPLSETFDEIKGLIGKYWDAVEDLENYLN